MGGHGSKSTSQPLAYEQRHKPKSMVQWFEENADPTWMARWTSQLPGNHANFTKDENWPTFVMNVYLELQINGPKHFWNALKEEYARQGSSHLTEYQWFEYNAQSPQWLARWKTNSDQRWHSPVTTGYHNLYCTKHIQKGYLLFQLMRTEYKAYQKGCKGKNIV